MNNEAYTLIVNASLQICIGKEALGDVYKKMKKYKLSERSYQEAAKELKKISEIKPGGQLKDETFERANNLKRKIQIKIAMCSYYQGDM